MHGTVGACCTAEVHAVCLGFLAWGALYLYLTHKLAFDKHYHPSLGLG